MNSNPYTWELNHVNRIESSCEYDCTDHNPRSTNRQIPRYLVHRFPSFHSQFEDYRQYHSNDPCEFIRRATRDYNGFFPISSISRRTSLFPSTYDVREYEQKKQEQKEIHIVMGRFLYINLYIRDIPYSLINFKVLFKVLPQIFFLAHDIVQV